MTVTMSSTIFCDVAPYSLVEIYLLYVGIFYQNVRCHSQLGYRECIY
jgi:hypothetical protein